jgi:hypothetical protein
MKRTFEVMASPQYHGGTKLMHDGMMAEAPKPTFSGKSGRIVSENVAGSVLGKPE